MTAPQLDQFVTGLNAEQKKAVEFNNVSLSVIAGAGSGKTRVLTHRIAWLMEKHGWSSDRILAVTFTNKAAQEMKVRLEKIGIQNVSTMWVGTFHGLAYRYLRRHYQAAGLSAHFQIIDQQEQEKIVKKLYKLNDWDVETNEVKEAIRYINDAKDKGLRPAAIKENNFFKHVYEHYENLCQQQNLVDFGELLLRCYELFVEHENIRLEYQTKYAHILVDEFQDTNEIQYQWIALLSDLGSAVPVTVVGDMDQSIYSWRGAQMTNVQRFLDEFSSAQTIKLEQNYRSVPSILKTANHLISHNVQRIEKNLWTSQVQDDPVLLYEAYDEKDEAEWAITKAIKQHRETKQWKDTAILYRSNAQSRIIEEACMKRNLPYKIYGGIRFFERAEIKDALGYLALTCDLHNDMMLERVLNTPTRGFGGKILDALKVDSLMKKESWALLLNNEAYIQTYATKKAQQAWKDLSASLSDPYLKTIPLDERVRWCVEKTGLLEHYQSIDKKDGSDRANNLLEFISVARRFTQGKKSVGDEVVLDFISSAALESENKHQEDDDAIQLMTIHASKGLEFLTVCAIGWDEGLFPSAQSIGDLQRLEEERRLAYVAITRAEKSLYISGAIDRRQYGQSMRLAPSRFIQELDPESVRWSRLPQRVYKINAPLQSTTTPLGPKIKTSASYWSMGDQVEHPQFGRGSVVRVDGHAQNDRIMVLFENGERKVLLPQLAKIKKV